MNIDMHCHSFPEEYVNVLREEGTVDDVAYVAGERGGHLLAEGGKQRLPLTPRMCSPASLLSAMDEAQLGLAVLSPASNMFHYGVREPSTAVRVVRAINEGFAAMEADAPERLRFFASVPMQHPSLALSELDHAVRVLGASGVAIATNVDGANLDEPELFPFFERVVQYELPLFIHPAHVAGADRLRAHFLSNLIGNPVETAIAVASLTFGGVMERLPRLRIIVCHGGGVVSSLRGRWRHGALARPAIAEAMSRPLDHYIERLYFDTITHDATALRFLLETMSDDNLVLGSDYPFEMGDAHPVSTLDAVQPLAESARTKILHGNAARLLGMPPS